MKRVKADMEIVERIITHCYDNEYDFPAKRVLDEMNCVAEQIGREYHLMSELDKVLKEVDAHEIIEMVQGQDFDTDQEGFVIDWWDGWMSSVEDLRCTMIEDRVWDDFVNFSIEHHYSMGCEELEEYYNMLDAEEEKQTPSASKIKELRDQVQELQKKISALESEEPKKSSDLLHYEKELKIKLGL